MASGLQDFHPDDFQMSIGDHLEELRRRILLGIFGLVPAPSAACCLDGEFWNFSAGRSFGPSSDMTSTRSFHQCRFLMPSWFT